MSVNIIDKVIEYLSPQRAYNRLAYREAIEARNYTAARTDDRFGNWFPRDQPAEVTDAPYRNLIRARARDLERNNAVLSGAVLGIVNNVIGLGIKPQAMCVSTSGKELTRINDKIEELWAEWTNAENCDITGHSDFYALQALFLRRMLVDGDGLIIRSTPADRARFPLILQMVEGDMFAEQLTRDKDRYIYGGVEVNDYMQPLAYHFVFDPRTYEVTRVPAERVVHGFVKFRAQQIRGVSALAPVMEPVRDIGQYIEYELKAARIAASLSGVIKSGTPQKIGRNMKVADSGDTSATQIEPGTMLNLRPGEDALFAQPGRPNVAASQFTQLILRFVGVGLGLSYESVSRDVSQVNYSSAREAKLQDIKTYEAMQEFVIKKFCRPIYNAWLDAAVLGGLVNIPGYWNTPAKYRKCRWVKPGWKWVDPLKEASGTEKQLALGLTTLQEVCGAMGTDWQENLEQQAREEQYKKDLGLQQKATTSGGDVNIGDQETDGGGN